MPKTGLTTISEVKDYRERFAELVAEMKKDGIEEGEIYALVVYAWAEKMNPYKE
jgi:hypothetical protein